MNFSLIFENNFKIIFPELFIIFTICFLLMYGVIYSSITISTVSNYIGTSINYTHKKLPPILINNITLLSIYALIITTLLIKENPIPTMVGFNNTYTHSDFYGYIKISVVLATIALLFLLLGYIKTNKFYFYEYVILILLALLGIIGIISANDLITMYLAIEMQSLALYVLAASKKNSEYSSEAGLKYFILGAISSGFLLFGSSLIYGFTGTTNFEVLTKLFCGFPVNFAEIISPSILLVNKGIIFGIIFIISGLLFKLAAAPFHMWSPDVYEGSPTIVTTFFVITPKIAIFTLLIKLLIIVFYDFIEIWQQIIVFSAICSLLIGAFTALPQKRLKRLLAYSSITHVGFMLIGLSTGTIEGIQALLIYVIGYMVMGVNIWSILLCFEINKSYESQNQSINSSSNNRLNYLTDLSMLHVSNPLLAFTFTIALFSLAGVPPLFGFFSKLFVLSAAVEVNMYSLALIGLLTSVLATFYYIKLIKIIYFEKIDRYYFYKNIDKEKSLILGISFAIILLFFIYPTPLFLFTHKLALLISL